MKIRTRPFTAPVISTVLVLLLAGCATGMQTRSATPSPPLDTAAADSIEEFRSVTAAREHAVHQSEELALLEESLAAASQDEPLEDTVAVLPETDADFPQLGVDAGQAQPQQTADNDDMEPMAEAPVAVAPDDIWQRLRSGFALPDHDHRGVNAHRDWYARHQSYLNRTFDRAEPYFHHIVEQVAARGMPLELALLPVVESAFQPFAYSHGRAAGLWQFIPGTARRYGLKIDWWYDGRRDVAAATDAALDYLEALHKRFDGDWLLALAAYNSGEGTVSRAVRNNQRRGKGTTFWDLQLPRETEGYVPKLLAISGIVAAPEKYDISLRPIANQPYLAELDIGSQLDLAIAAEMAGMTLEDLYLLNPAFNRWATPPDGPHRLLLPLDKADGFAQQLAQLPHRERVKWVRHRIREGETLGHIAVKYKTTVKTIQTTNKIRGNIIRAGNYLIIPAASQSLDSYALSEAQRRHSTQNKSRAGTKSTYAVQRGDTLWDIAMAHKVSVRQVAAWNGMAPRDTLRPGQTLVIWSKADGLAAPAANPLAESLTRKINYRVRSGDSLARISQRFNVSVADLKQWNPKARGKYIQPGQRLVVYVDVTKVAENI
jgi:membrane-bound lytic murein transglycosylase D